MKLSYISTQQVVQPKVHMFEATINGNPNPVTFTIATPDATPITAARAAELVKWTAQLELDIRENGLGVRDRELERFLDSALGRPESRIHY